MTTRKPKVPAYPGQGRTMLIEGAVVSLIAVAIVGITMYATDVNSPIGFTLVAVGALIALTGVYRVHRGSLFESIENTVGPSLFQETPVPPK